MFDIHQFRDLVIEPALDILDLNSQAAVELLLGTALIESGLKYLKQLGNGPAVGVYQMEPRTHSDIWTNYLHYKPDLVKKVRKLAHRNSEFGPAQQMVGNLWYATAMARIHYYRVRAPLPAAGDIEAQASYWKRHYNTHLGKGTTDKYITTWNRCMT